MLQQMKWIAAACILPVLGCVVNEDNDGRGDVGELIQAIGSECAAASPSVTFIGGANFTSFQTYNTTSCFKAVVIDIDNYSSAFLGAGGPPGGTYIFWADAAPTTQSACNDSYVRADLFEWISNTWSYKYFKDSHGTWGDPFAFCQLLPRTGFTSADLQAGHTYRIAATARTAATSAAATRIVSVVSQQPVVIQ